MSHPGVRHGAERALMLFRANWLRVKARVCAWVRHGTVEVVDFASCLHDPGLLLIDRKIVLPPRPSIFNGIAEPETYKCSVQSLENYALVRAY